MHRTCAGTSHDGWISGRSSIETVGDESSSTVDLFGGGALSRVAVTELALAVRSLSGSLSLAATFCWLASPLSDGASTSGASVGGCRGEFEHSTTKRKYRVFNWSSKSGH